MGSKRVAILQSNYVPWKGYFDLMASVDEFILYDDVQYTRRDWRNRNRFKSPAGVRWLTIPVESKGRYEQLIEDTCVSDPDWSGRHWSTISSWYSRAPMFDRYRELLEGLYLRELAVERRLSLINRRLIEIVSGLLGIATRITSSRDYEGQGRSTERLLTTCLAAGADTYLSGPAARSYLDVESFERAGVAVEWMNYDGYREYPQLYPPFEHHVSVLDLLFSVGSDARDYMLQGR